MPTKKSSTSTFFTVLPHNTFKQLIRIKKRLFLKNWTTFSLIQITQILSGQDTSQVEWLSKETPNKREGFCNNWEVFWLLLMLFVNLTSWFKTKLNTSNHYFVLSKLWQLCNTTTEFQALRSKKLAMITLLFFKTVLIAFTTFTMKFKKNNWNSTKI